MKRRLVCEEVETGATDYLEKALSDDLQRQFESHLAGCADCRLQIALIRWTSDQLTSLPREAMPPGMKDRIIQAIPRTRRRTTLHR